MDNEGLGSGEESLLKTLTARNLDNIGSFGIVGIKCLAEMFICIICILVTLTGCAKVYIAGSIPATYWNLGVININVPEENDSPLLLLSEGFGLMFGSQSTTFGWSKELLIVAPDSEKCRVFIVVQSDAELIRLKDMLKHNSKLLENICFFSQEGLK